MGNSCGCPRVGCTGVRRACAYRGRGARGAVCFAGEGCSELPNVCLHPSSTLKARLPRTASHGHIRTSAGTETFGLCDAKWSLLALTRNAWLCLILVGGVRSGKGGWPQGPAAEAGDMLRRAQPCMRVHSSMVGAAGCRSAGPWFQSGFAIKLIQVIKSYVVFHACASRRHSANSALSIACRRAC